MTDVLTKPQRSFNMSRIKGRNTGPEIAVKRALELAGLGRFHSKSDLPGRPDVIFPSEKIAVFVDGCFWHGCPVHYNAPSTRPEFWARKLKGNVLRDRDVNAALKSKGWYVIRVWEHEVNANPSRVAALVRARLQSIGARG